MKCLNALIFHLSVLLFLSFFDFKFYTYVKLYYTIVNCYTYVFYVKLKKTLKINATTLLRYYTSLRIIKGGIYGVVVLSPRLQAQPWLLVYRQATTMCVQTVSPHPGHDGKPAQSMGDTFWSLECCK